MNRLVVHQIYANGMAFDLSGFRNHGVPYAVSQAIAPFAPGFDYTQQDSRVIVAPSTSLEDLLAVRAIEDARESYHTHNKRTHDHPEKDCV